jgi:hypothetical protein
MQINNSKIAGILSIVAGSLGLFSAFILVCLVLLFMLIPTLIPHSISSSSSEFSSVAAIISIFYGCISFFFAVLGVLAIIGGVSALKRRRWSLALAGAIASVILNLACGVAAIIFITMGKHEFYA